MVWFIPLVLPTPVVVVALDSWFTFRKKTWCIYHSKLLVYQRLYVPIFLGKSWQIPGFPVKSPCFSGEIHIFPMSTRASYRCRRGRRHRGDLPVQAVPRPGRLFQHGKTETIRDAHNKNYLFMLYNHIYILFIYVYCVYIYIWLHMYIILIHAYLYMNAYTHRYMYLSICDFCVFCNHSLLIFLEIAISPAEFQ